MRLATVRASRACTTDTSSNIRGIMNFDNGAVPNEGFGAAPYNFAIIDRSDKQAINYGILVYGKGQC